MENIFPMRLIELLLGKCWIWTWWRCHAASITNSDIFMCVNFQCGARTILRYVRDNFSTLKLIGQKRNIKATAQKIPIHNIDINLFHHQRINHLPLIFLLLLSSLLFSSEALHFSCELKRHHFDGHCMWSPFALIASVIMQARSFCTHDASCIVSIVCTFWIILYLSFSFLGQCFGSLSMCLCVKYSGTFLLFGCEFTSFIFQSHFELFTIFRWRLECWETHTSVTNNNKSHWQLQLIPFHTNISMDFRRCITCLGSLHSTILLCGNDVIVTFLVYSNCFESR